MTSLKHSRALLAMAAALTAGPVLAQSSVTLYGIADNGFMYQNSSTTLGSTSGGASKLAVTSGIWAQSRWGLRGVEDLGGGFKTVFQLESGFSIDTGALAQGGLLFGRMAFVGLTSDRYGQLTAGRNYTPYFMLLAPYGPTRWVGIHAGDIDAFDYTFHINNQVMYISPKIHGFTFGGSYAFGGVAGAVNQGSTWSVAVNYASGPLGLGVGFFRINNATPGGGAYSTSSTAYSGGQTALSSLTNGYQTAQAQNRFAVVGLYTFNNAWDISASYSNVQYIPGVNSAFLNTATFNTVGSMLHYKPSVFWDLALGYSYTRATKSNGITNEAHYHQVNLIETYALSKATNLYAYEAYQHAGGQTLGTNGKGDVIAATASIADFFQSSPSSTGNQVAVGVGLIHRF